MYGYAADAMSQMARFNQDRRLVAVKSPLDPEPFVVHRLQGTEAVSKPFSLSAELLSQGDRLELKQIVGQTLCFTLPTPDGERHFHGYVKQFSRAGTDGDLVRYRAEVAPWFDFLKHTSNCRVFQDVTVLDIVEQVFSHYPELAQCKYQVAAARYTKLPYCVQYNESDFAFVSRLLEDAGIYYFFEHTADAHTMVLADDSTQSPPIGPHEVVRFQTDQGVHDEPGIDGWNATRRIASNAHARKSFDFKQPRSPLLVNTSSDQPHGMLPPLESYSYDGAARYSSSDTGSTLNNQRADETTWQTKLFEATGTYGDLQAGHYFVLQGHNDHAEADAESRQFFLLQTSLDARNNFTPNFSEAEGCIYRCEATCLRRKIPYRPLRVTPAPYMRGPQTATVVGPSGEEIWTDRYGRIKVQFHWDRLGQYDENSSCWVRVSSPWAGPGMGGVSAPRIGQEVVVDFLDGDPDRPIVTGRVYNEDNAQPFDKEVSGIRSKTVQGEGYNELTMHDTAGSELLNMRAQRDMATTVLNDHNSTIGNDKSTAVTSNHSLNVGANQAIAITGNQGITVGGNHSSSITGNSSHAIEGALSAAVVGAVTEQYQSGQSLTIASGGYNESITGNYATTLNGNHLSQRNGTWNETVTGTSARTVNGAVTETLGAGRSVAVTGTDQRQVAGPVQDVNTGTRTVSVDGAMTHEVTGTHTSVSNGDMNLASASKMVLGVGGAGIEIVDGKIQISVGGSTIVIDGGGISLNGAKINLN